MKSTIVIELAGTTGNAFYILGATMKALRKEGRADDAERYHAEAVSGNYEQLLKVTRKYVKLICK